MEVTPVYFWFGLSILLFSAEAFGLPGLGFLFAALAALCVGALMEFNVIGSDAYLVQATSFLLLTTIWAIILWKPLKQWRMQKSAQSHNDIIGRTATVTAEGLAKGKSGKAHWSGTQMRARLAADAAVETASEGDELLIVDVQNSTLILAELTYPLPPKE